MKSKIEYPLVEPIYSTYHGQGAGTAIFTDNPSIRNWYLNEVMILRCSRGFLSGGRTPGINIVNSDWRDNPYIDRLRYEMKYLNGHIHYVIKNMLKSGYYVYFRGIDDYYVDGKCWYRKRHFLHDGTICGYNPDDKTYCIYSYDSNWIYQKFWTPQKSFEKGRQAMFKEKRYGTIWAFKPKDDIVKFCPESAIKKIEEYLDSTLEKYPLDEEGHVYGIAVHDYLIMYVRMLYDQNIAYDQMDRRIFRLVWEHKKLMLERIQCIESSLFLDSEISNKYCELVDVANHIRMLYASHHMKRKDAVLPVIEKQLKRLKDDERDLLEKLLRKRKG